MPISQWIHWSRYEKLQKTWNWWRQKENARRWTWKVYHESFKRPQCREARHSVTTLESTCPAVLPAQSSVCQPRSSPEVFSPGNGNKSIICKRLNIDHNFIFISYYNLYVSASLLSSVSVWFFSSKSNIRKFASTVNIKKLILHHRKCWWYHSMTFCKVCLISVSSFTQSHLILCGPMDYV